MGAAEHIAGQPVVLPGRRDEAGDMSAGQVMLRAGDATATVALLGAEPRTWHAAGRDLLWQPDARWWDATCPVLFPVCGWLNGGVIRTGGHTYPLGLHGFASRRVFTLLDATADTALLELCDDAATWAVFPFAFRLHVQYRLTATALAVTFTVSNPGDGVLPYGIGLHPGFAWPFAGGARDDHMLEFERPEAPEIPIHENGLITGRSRPLPWRGRELPLSDALFAPGGINIRDAASRRVVFRAPDGTEIELAFEALPNIVVWSRPGAPFLCVEGWQGTNDHAGFTGDIADKPGMRLLVPGAEQRHAATMTVRV